MIVKLVCNTLMISAVAFGGIKFDGPNVIVESYNGQTSDRREEIKIYTPQTVEQLNDIITAAHKNGMKVRMLGASHSTSSIIVSGSTVYISTQYLNKIGEIKKTSKGYTVKVQPGVTLEQLGQHLAAHGFTLGFNFPMYGGITMAGLIATGSHGSSMVHPAISAQTVESLKLMTADGNVLDVDQKQADLFKAATVNMGQIGAVTELELKIEANFNIKMSTHFKPANEELFSKKGKVTWFGPNHEGAIPDYAQVMWFPNAKVPNQSADAPFKGMIVRYEGQKTTEPAVPTARAVNFGTYMGINEANYGARKALAKTGVDAEFASGFESARIDTLQKAPPFAVLENGRWVRKMELVGTAHDMLTSLGTDALQWPYQLQDTSFSFPESKAYDVLKTISDFVEKTGYSFPITGLSMRFAKSDGGRTSFLSHVERPENKGELFVMAEMLEYYEPGKPEVTATRDALRDQLISLLIEKHNIAFHLGKNNDKILTDKYLAKKTYGEYQEKFTAVQKQVDPKGMFTTPFMDKFLAPNVCHRFYVN